MSHRHTQKPGAAESRFFTGEKAGRKLGGSKKAQEEVRR